MESKDGKDPWCFLWGYPHEIRHALAAREKKNQNPMQVWLKMGQPLATTTSNFFVDETYFGLPKFDFVGGFIPVYRFPPHAPHGPASISSIAQVWPCMPPLRGNRWAAKRGILKDDSSALAMFMTRCCWEHLSPLSPNGTTIHPTALY